MSNSNLTHPTYTFVDEKDADALAWVFTDSKSPMKKAAFKFPPLKPNEIRAKVLYNGLCHTDLHSVREDWGPCSYPIAPGHEIIGVVTQLGSEVKDFEIGEHVGFGFVRDCCGKCEFCKMGADQLCEGQLEQAYVFGPKYWGGFATSIQHPAKFFHKLPKDLPEEKIAPLFCAGVTMYAPIAKYAKPGHEVAVLGIGGLGHMGVMFAKAWGCNVTAFTSSLDKIDLIKKLGADRILLSNDDVLKQETGKFNVVLNTIPSGEKLHKLIPLTRKLGTFVQVGIPSIAKLVPISLIPIVFQQITLAGSLVGSRKEMKEMLSFCAKHKILPLCEMFDFDHFPKALETLEYGKPKFRCVVDYTKAKL